MNLYYYYLHSLLLHRVPPIRNLFMASPLISFVPYSNKRKKEKKLTQCDLYQSHTIILCKSQKYTIEEVSKLVYTHIYDRIT